MAKFEMYSDKSGQWCWRFRTNNGKIIADSSEGYINKNDCENGIRIVKNEASSANIIHI
ncbi:YegP family protein [[Eubacterium] cellulosolvens]